MFTYSMQANLTGIVGEIYIMPDGILSTVYLGRARTDNNSEIEQQLRVSIGGDVLSGMYRCRGYRGLQVSLQRWKYK